MILPLLMINTANIAKNCREHEESRLKTERLRNEQIKSSLDFIPDILDIDKSARIYKLLEISKELNKSFFDGNNIIHEIDVYSFIDDNAVIISKKGQFCIKGCIKFNNFILKDNYIEEFKKEVSKVTNSNEIKLIKASIYK